MPDRCSVAYVPTLPYCDLHMIVDKQNDVIALYDAKTSDGRWASMCEDHFNAENASVGLGKGQRYIVGEPPKVDKNEQRAAVNAAILSGDWDAMEDAVGDGDIADWL